MSKQLSLKMIKEENKKYDEVIDLTFTRGDEEFVIKVNPYFSPLKIKNLLKEYKQFIDNTEKEKVKITDEEKLEIIPCFMIKEFTDINFGTAKTAKSVFANFKALMNHIMFKEIVNAFPETSKVSVLEEINDRIGEGAKIQRLFEQTQEELKNLPLENKEVLFGVKDEHKES